MLRRRIILLIAIRLSNGDVKSGCPLGAFQKEQAMSRHWVSPSPFLSSSSHTTQITLHKQLHIQSPEPQLSTVHYTDTRPTRNVVCPSGAWFKNRPHLTPSIHFAWNPKHIIVQWVGIGTHTCLENIICNKIIKKPMDTTFLNIRNFNWLLHIATHLFAKSVHDRSAKFTTRNFECMVCLKKFPLQ